MTNDRPNQSNRQLAERRVARARSTSAFPLSVHEQTDLILTLSKFYFVMGGEDQQWARAQLIQLIPRVRDDAQPQWCAQEMMKLGLGTYPYEEISRAVKTGLMEAQPFKPLPDEAVYTREIEGWLQRYMLWARNSEVPLGYHFWCAVAAMGAACKFTVFIDRGIESIKMNHYVLLVGEKATGKGIAMEAALDILHRMNLMIEPDPKKFHFHQVRILPEDTNQETLIRKLATFTADYQVEDKTQTVEVDSTGLLVFDELATFMGRQSWKVEQKMAFLTTLYQRKRPYIYETQSGGRLILKNAVLSMIACCAPEWMRETITPLMFGGGFTDRLHFVSRDSVDVKDRSYPTALPRDPIIANQLARELLKWAQIDGQVEMMAEPAAQEWYDHWYSTPDSTISDPDQVKTSRKRRANQVWRLAAIFSLSEESAPWIKEKHFRKAASLLKEEERQFLLFIDRMNEPHSIGHERYIQDVLLKHGGTMLQGPFFQILRHRKGLSPPTKYAMPYLLNMQACDMLKIEREGRTVRYTLTERGKKVGRAPHYYGKPPEREEGA